MMGDMPEHPAPETGEPSIPGPRGLHPVSPLLIRARYLGHLVAYVIALVMIAGLIVLAVLVDQWWIGLFAILPIVYLVQSLALMPRRVRAIGYLEGESELTVGSGLLFRTVTTVPMGRIQSVTLSEGPILRRYGLAELDIKTAAGLGGATLPGLPREEAQRLRARLMDRGVRTMAAL